MTGKLTEIDEMYFPTVVPCIVLLCVLAAFSEEEVNMWMTGLNWLMMDTQRAPIQQQTDRLVLMCSENSE